VFILITQLHICIRTKFKQTNW